MLSLKKTFFLIFVANSGNLASYLFQVLSARTMSPSDYGLFNALNSLVVVMSAPLPVGNMLVTKLTIKISSVESSLVASLRDFLLKRGVILAIFIWIVGFLSLPFLKKYFHLSEKIPLCILITHAGLIVLIPIFIGMLQGLRFYLMQALGIALFSWGRLASGGIFAYDGYLSVSEALLCSLISIVFVSSLAGLFLKYKFSSLLRNSQKINFIPFFRKELKSSLPYLALNYLIIALFLNADMIFARHYLSSQEVGLYAVAAIIGRIAFYLPGILVAVVFAESVRQTREKDLFKLGILAGLASFAFGGICWFAPDFLIRLLMGVKYIGAASYLKVIALGMSFLSLANFVFSYFLGRGKYNYLYGLFFSALLTFGAILIRFHYSPMEIALTLTVGTFTTFLWAIFIYWRFYKKINNSLHY